jgi:hypothetical protein
MRLPHLARRPSRRAVLLLVVTAIGLTVGAAIAVAATSGQAVHSRAGGLGPAAPRISGVANGACQFGYDTHTDILTPPDDSTANNPPAGLVTLVKPCKGPVIGSFTSEVGTPDADDFIHIDMRATCVAAPCTVGASFFGNPGHTFFQNNVQPGVETNAMDMVWGGLGPGTWRFEVLPGGDGTAFLFFRTFTVVAYSRG